VESHNRRKGIALEWECGRPTVTQAVTAAANCFPFSKCDSSLGTQHVSR
jgi:hypothetical protein